MNQQFARDILTVLFDAMQTVQDSCVNSAVKAQALEAIKQTLIEQSYTSYYLVQDEPIEVTLAEAKQCIDCILTNYPVLRAAKYFSLNNQTPVREVPTSLPIRHFPVRYSSKLPSFRSPRPALVEPDDVQSPLRRPAIIDYTRCTAAKRTRSAGSEDGSREAPKLIQTLAKRRRFSLPNLSKT